MRITSDIFPAWLTQNLEKQSIGVRKIAKTAGVSETTVSFIKNRRQGASLYTFERIVDALGYEIHLVRKGNYER